MNNGRTDRLSRTLFTKTILDELRTRIVSGQYPDKFPLSESQLAEEFAVSRGPVRTALHSLEQEGLVETLSNGRIQTIGFTAQRAEDLFNVRLYLEEYAVREIVSNGVSVYELGQIVESMAKTSMDRENLTRLDMEFHRVLLETAGNWALLQAWRTLIPVVHAVLSITNREFANVDYIVSIHRELVDAIAARDLQRALSLLKDQFATTKNVIIPRLESQLAQG
ncbi:MAG: GntR family transcriptional regulator [Alicyclobacillus sp.]|nr:GntR family transcriptional regulator [Alicyclobacillus sp.]